MEDFHSLLIKRRSYRKFKNQEIAGDDVQLILEAALLSPTSKNKRSWQFVVVEDKDMLQLLSKCKPKAASLLSSAALAIVVVGNPLESDVWIEDTSIAAFSMQLQAEDLGLGSCWVQIRERNFTEDISSTMRVNELLEIPFPLEVLSIMAFGYKEKPLNPNSEDRLLWENVHIGKFKTSETSL